MDSNTEIDHRVDLLKMDTFMISVTLMATEGQDMHQRDYPGHAKVGHFHDVSNMVQTD